MKLAPLTADASDIGGSSQAVKAQLRLREMIFAGELPGGARIAEVAVSEQLGVSRTPVRTARFMSSRILALVEHPADES